MTWTLPNILTVLRLLSAIAVGVVFAIFPRPIADWVALILFIGAATTDYLDGYLARKWAQVSRFGAMLDPIADKAMVVIALAILVGLFDLSVALITPVVLILFREVFVSGLREFLGADAGRLKVTKLAKWKTMVQMVAIVLMFLWAIAEHSMQNDHSFGTFGLHMLRDALAWGGLGMLWLATVLTFITGCDYFLKALPFLSDQKG